MPVCDENSVWICALVRGMCPATAVHLSFTRTHMSGSAVPSETVVPRLHPPRAQVPEQALVGHGGFVRLRDKLDLLGGAVTSAVAQNKNQSC